MIDLSLLTQKNQTLQRVIGWNIAGWQILWVRAGRFERAPSSARGSLALCGRFDQFRSPYFASTMRRALRKRRVSDFEPSYLKISESLSFFLLLIKPSSGRIIRQYQQDVSVVKSTGERTQLVAAVTAEVHCNDRKYSLSAIWAAIPTHTSRAASVLRKSRCWKKPSVFACLSTFGRKIISTAWWSSPRQN